MKTAFEPFAIDLFCLVELWRQSCVNQVFYDNLFYEKYLDINLEPVKHK